MGLSSFITSTESGMKLIAIRAVLFAVAVACAVGFLISCGPSDPLDYDSISAYRYGTPDAAGYYQQGN